MRKSHAILDAIKNFQKEGLFIGQKFLRMDDQKPGLLRKQHVAKGEELEQKVNTFKICVKLWGALKKLM